MCFPKRSANFRYLWASIKILAKKSKQSCVYVAQKTSGRLSVLQHVFAQVQPCKL